MSNVTSTLVLISQFSFSWLKNIQVRSQNRLDFAQNSFVLYSRTGLYIRLCSTFIFMVMMSLQALVQWCFVGNSITYILYWNYLWVAIGLDYIIAWILDMLELFISYRRVSISNTDTQTHRTDCHINVHVVCIDCSICIVFALREVMRF